MECGVLSSETEVLSSATLCRWIGAVLHWRACNERVRLDGISLRFFVKLGILFVYVFRRWVLVQSAKMHFLSKILIQRAPVMCLKKVLTTGTPCIFL